MHGHMTVRCCTYLLCNKSFKKNVLFGYPGFSNCDAANKLVIAIRLRLVPHIRCACAVSRNANPVLTVVFAVHGNTVGHRTEPRPGLTDL